MLAFAVIQIVFAVGAVYYGGKVAMSFGRDLRKIPRIAIFFEYCLNELKPVLIGVELRRKK
jgi:hypothetical protein